MAPGVVSIYSGWRAKEIARLAAIEAALAHERLVAAPAAPIVPVGTAAHGRDLFATTCVACHGPTGTGVAGLGKNLLESDFVAATGDADLAHFLVTGRPTANPPMPPRAGRPDLTDSDIADLVVYLRGLQDPRRMPELPPMVIAKAEVTEADKAQALEAAGGDAELAGWIASGHKLYSATCIACHGPDGGGIKGNGKPLATSEFIKTLDDDALLAFIKRGRDPGDPKNTTGIAMPPKGGNPALSDDDLLDVISYLRSLSKQSGAPLNAQAVSKN
jgi:disulfide bond formation protein DsbB